MASADSPQRQAYEDDPQFINLSEWWSFLLRRRWAFALACAVSVVVGVTVALLLPKTYTARASILPGKPVSPASAMLAQMGGIAASVLGPSETMAALYPDVAKSRTIFRETLNAPFRETTLRNILIQLEDFDVDDPKLEDDLYNYFTKEVDASLNPATNFFTLSFTSGDPEFAAALVNEIVRQMDYHQQDWMKTESRGESEMIQRRLAEEADSLRVAEERLLHFRENNRAITLSPSAMLEEARLAREMEIHSTLYVELTKQLEVARIEEYRNMPVLHVLDWAVTPVKKSGPKRRLIVALFLLGGFLGTLVLLKVRDTPRPGA